MAAPGAASRLSGGDVEDRQEKRERRTGPEDATYHVTGWEG